MTRRALLLGSATYGLTGVDHDLATMTAVLHDRGFDAVTVVRAADATRDGMRAALDRLCAETQPGDAVVLFYSGHGSRLLRPDAAERRAQGREPHVQFLVPTDVDATTASDFRGLVGGELTAATRALTGTTRNVTVLLDCCHAGAMVRGLDLVPKSTQPSLAVDAGAELADRLAAQRQREGWEANPVAVRVAACETDRTAYEVPRLDGPGRAGLFTGVLAETLREVGPRRVSWRTLLARVREQVQVVVQQRPDVEGPAGRVPFGLDELPLTEVLPVRRLARSVVVEAAVLLGVAPGDELRVLREEDESVVADTTVVALDGADAVLDLAPEQVERGVGLVAVPLRTGVRRTVTIDLPAADPLHGSLVAALEASPRLAPGLTGALATVRREADGLVVVDAAGARARTDAVAADETGVGAALALLEQLAAGDRLRNLPSGTGAAAFDEAEVGLELSRWHDGVPELVTGGEVRLHRGDRVSLTVRNHGPSPAYVWVFDVGVSGRIALVSDDLPAGRPLAPAGQPGDAHAYGDPGGIALGWPADVPADLPRPETLVVVAADRPADLRALESAGRDARAFADPASLPAVLAQVGSGVRELGGVRGDALRYRTVRRDLLLVPSPRPAAGAELEPAFEVDDRPDLTARLVVPRGPSGVPAAPRTLAVRLTELVVRRNRALFGADVRLDWLAVTAGASGEPVPVVGTDRFPRVADGDALPIDAMLLFHGEVRDYLELRLWVGRDDRRGADLTDLLAARLGEAGVQGALATVVGLAVAAPAAAVAVGAVAAVATLTKVVAELVGTATGKDIGVYRTSLLALDGFGTEGGPEPGRGRIPATGRRQAVDVELALEVLAVD